MSRSWRSSHHSCVRLCATFARELVAVSRSPDNPDASPSAVKDGDLFGTAPAEFCAGYDLSQFGVRVARRQVVEIPHEIQFSQSVFSSVEQASEGSRPGASDNRLRCRSNRGRREGVGIARLLASLVIQPNPHGAAAVPAKVPASGLIPCGGSLDY